MFEVHVLNDQGIEKARILQKSFKEFLSSIEEMCGSDGREMSIVRTKLEEASFFAKRAMAMNPVNHDEVLD
jgi:hypothetical protein